MLLNKRENRRKDMLNRNNFRFRKARQSTFFSCLNCCALLMILFLQAGCSEYMDITPMVTNYDPGQAYNGYTYIHLTAGPFSYYTIICVDMNGQIVWESKTKFGDLNRIRLGFEMTHDNNILTNFNFHPVIIDPYTDSIVWENTSVDMHHSIIMNPVGNVMVLGFEDVPSENSQGEPCVVKGDTIIEVDPQTDNVIWQWRLADHVDPTVYYHREPCFYDWSHGNSIKFYSNYSYLGTNHEAILLTARNMSTVYMIDYPSGEILWSFGEMGTFGSKKPSAPPLFGFVHEADLMENGNILLYSNASNIFNQQSQAMEFSIDPELGTEELVWSWGEGSIDYWGGDVDRLPNGNTLITSVVTGKLTEVNPAGEIVWQMELRSTARPDISGLLSIYKMKRVENF